MGVWPETFLGRASQCSRTGSILISLCCVFDFFCRTIRSTTAGETEEAQQGFRWRKQQETGKAQGASGCQRWRGSSEEGSCPCPGSSQEAFSSTGSSTQSSWSSDESFRDVRGLLEAIGKWRGDDKNESQRTAEEQRRNWWH